MRKSYAENSSWDVIAVTVLTMPGGLNGDATAVILAAVWRNPQRGIERKALVLYNRRHAGDIGGGAV